MHHIKYSSKRFSTRLDSTAIAHLQEQRWAFYFYFYFCFFIWVEKIDTTRDENGMQMVNCRWSLRLGEQADLVDNKKK